MRLGSLIVFLFLFFGFDDLMAQPEMIHIGEDAPSYMKLFQKESVNAIELDKAYKAYYKTHPFEKNVYTQYFKRIAIFIPFRE